MPKTCLRIALAVLAGLLSGASFAQAQRHISVWVVDAKTGTPLKGVWVGMNAWRPGTLETPLNAKTDEHGLASFPVPKPKPEIIELNPDFDLRWCSDLAFPTDQILKTGLIAKLRCDYGGKWSGQLIPGQLVVFARRRTLWERMRVEIPGFSTGRGAVVPRQTAECKFADGQMVTSDYSGGPTWGFPIFGGRVQYGQIWGGRDEATFFVTPVPIKVGGKDVPAGHYTIFTIPNPDRWTLIISKKTGEWSRPYPGESYDLTRTEMIVSTLPSRIENFTIAFDEERNACTMHLDWENTRASVEIAEGK